jgi:hypothetical protein
MTHLDRPRSIEELRNHASTLGLAIRQDGTKWLAIRAKDTTVIAKEQSERMVLACAIARLEAGVFSDKPPITINILEEGEGWEHGYRWQAVNENGQVVATGSRLCVTEQEAEQDAQSWMGRDPEEKSP